MGEYKKRPPRLPVPLTGDLYKLVKHSAEMENIPMSDYVKDVLIDHFEEKQNTSEMLQDAVMKLNSKTADIDGNIDVLFKLVAAFIRIFYQHNSMETSDMFNEERSAISKKRYDDFMNGFLLSLKKGKKSFMYDLLSRGDINSFLEDEDNVI